MSKVMVVDDDIKLVENIRVSLEKEELEVFFAFTGQQALDTIRAIAMDLIILNLELPVISGDIVLQCVRETSNVPAIMMKESSLSLELADSSKQFGEYIEKPFEMSALTQRVKEILAKSKKATQGSLISFNSGKLVIDFEKHEVMRYGDVIRLTRYEWKILTALTKNPRQVFSRDQLIERVMGLEFEGYDRTIDSHIKNIRQKIEDDPANPNYIQTVHGVGYVFSVLSDDKI